MDSVQLNELKDSYYDYIVKVPQGLQMIVNFLSKNELEKAYNGIADLAEGLEFLLKIELVLKEKQFTVNSRIEEAITIFAEMNESLVNGDHIFLKDLIEYELSPIFISASEWVFQDEVK